MGGVSPAGTPTITGAMAESSEGMPSSAFTSGAFQGRERTPDDAGAEAQGVGREHQVLGRQPTVRRHERPRRTADDHQGPRPIKDVEVGVGEGLERVTPAIQVGRLHLLAE